MPQIQKKDPEKKETKDSSKDSNPRPKPGSASQEKIPVRLPWNGNTVPLSAEDINLLYSTYQVTYGEWMDLRRAHNDSMPWPGEDPLALYKKTIDESLAEIKKFRASIPNEPPKTKTAIGKVLSYGLEGASVLATGTFHTMDLIFALSGITAIAKGMGTTTTKVAMEMGYDPRTADAIGTAAEFGYGMLFPSTTVNTLMFKTAKRAMAVRKAASLPKIQRIEKAAAAIDNLVDELGGTGETVVRETGTDVANVVKDLPKLRTPLEEAMDAFRKHFAITRDRVLEIRERVTRGEIAQRAHEGRIEEVLGAPELTARLRQELNPIINNLFDEYERMATNGTREEDLIEFIAKLYPIVDAMPEYFGRSASAARTLGEMRDPTKVTTEQMKGMFDFFSRITDTPVNPENWREWKDVASHELGKMFGRENPKALPGFLTGVGHSGFDHNTIGAIYKMNLVSGFNTWFANVLGGGWQLATGVPKGVLAANYGKMLGDEARSATLETLFRVGGMMKGISTYGQDLASLMSKNPSKSMLEALTGHDPKTEGVMGVAKKNPLLTIVGGGGFILAALDQALRYPVLAGELAARGVVEARRQGVPFSKLVDFVDEFIKAPTPQARMAATALAEEAAATTSLGPAMRQVARARQGIDDALHAPVMTLGMPFIKSGSSLAKTVFNDTPMLGAISKTTREALESGDGMRAADALARQTFAQMFSTFAMGMAATGMVTGDGPVDPKLRSQWEATGWKPRTLVIGDRQFDLMRLSPLGDVLVGFANIYDLWKTGDLSEADLEKSMKAGMWTMVSFYSGLNYMDLFGEMTQFFDPGKEPEGIFQKLATVAGNMIPGSGLWRQTSQIENLGPGPMRLPQDEFKDTLERVQATVGGWGGRYRRNVFGDIQKYKLPLQGAQPLDEDAEYIRNLGVIGLKPPDARLYGPPVPGTEFSDQDEYSPPFNMTEEEADYFSEAKGVAFRELVKMLRTSPDVMKLSKSAQRSLVTSLYRNQAEGLATGALIKKFPQIAPDLEEFFTLKGRLLAGEITTQEFKKAKSNRISGALSPMLQGSYIPPTSPEGGNVEPQTQTSTPESE